MNKLLLLSVVGLAACTQQNGVHGDWSEGAGFAPSTAAEYHARAKRGEPGLYPAPSGYSLYTARQRAATSAASGTAPTRVGTASSRTGEYISANFAGATLASGAPASANAVVAANQAGAGSRVTLNGQIVKVSHVDVGRESYAVVQSVGVGGVPSTKSAALEAALPQLTGCHKASSAVQVGQKMVYALKC